MPCEKGHTYIKGYTTRHGITRDGYCRSDVGKKGKTPDSEKVFENLDGRDLGEIVFPQLSPKKREGKFKTVTIKKCFASGLAQRHDRFGKVIQKHERKDFLNDKRILNGKFIAIRVLHKNTDPTFAQQIEKCRQGFISGFDLTNERLPSSKNKEWNVTRSYLRNLRS